MRSCFALLLSGLLAAIDAPAQRQWRSMPIVAPVAGASPDDRTDHPFGRRTRRSFDVVVNGRFLAWLVIDADVASHVPRSRVLVYVERLGGSACLVGVLARVRGARPRVAIDRRGTVFVETRGRVHVFARGAAPRVLIPPAGTELLRYDATRLLVAEPGRPASLALYRLDANDRPVDRRRIAIGRAGAWRLPHRRAPCVDGHFWFAGGRGGGIVALDKRTATVRRLAATGVIDGVARGWLFVRDGDVARLVHVEGDASHALLAPARIRHVGPYGILHDGPAGARWWDPIDGRRADVALASGSRIVGGAETGLIVIDPDGVRRFPTPVVPRPVAPLARALGRAACERLRAVHAASVASGRWETGAALYDVAWPLAPGTGGVLLAIAARDPDPNARRLAARLVGRFDVPGAADALLALGGEGVGEGLLFVAGRRHVDRWIASAREPGTLEIAARGAAIHGTSIDPERLRARGVSARSCALVAGRDAFIAALRAQRGE